MALKGTLVDYLLDVRPHIMVAVPRLYEKMEDKVRLALEQKPKIMKWALEVIFF
jgi:long-subunit acyl-CoA synthetase (AMP-forming)